MTETKIQRILQQIKSKLTKQEHHRLHPPGSCPRKFYGTAEIHRSISYDKKDQLPKRPIVSNIGTATSNLARHLALLSPLSKCKYTIDSMKHFMKRLNKKQCTIDL